LVELDELSAAPDAAELIARSRGVPAVRVGLLRSSALPSPSRRALTAWATRPVAAAGHGVRGPQSQPSPTAPGPPGQSLVERFCDLVLAAPDVDPLPAWAVRVPDLTLGIEQLTETIARNPIAAVTLTLLLRREVPGSIDEGLVAESAAYSTLQAGPEFAAWRSARLRPPRAIDGPVVVARREANTLWITLSAPHVHNAFSRRMRDELCEALILADLDDSVRRIVLDGAGPSFCSGGYLDEFGSLPDPASAHLIRQMRSAGRLLGRLAERVEVRLHGAAMGAGIELAAFARRVIADPGTRIGLPELALGLLPGAGGTVSLPRRIGRHRTLFLGLCGAPVDAATALEWGLIDALADRSRWQPPFSTPEIPS
jgi:enoyl-CoA hydratase/carnithine racemase